MTFPVSPASKVAYASAAASMGKRWVIIPAAGRPLS